MAEEVVERVVVRAPLKRCYEVVSQIDGYAEWVPHMREVEVLDRDRKKRPKRVAFKVGAFGRSTSYTLDYDYSSAPRGLSWVQVDGDLMSKLDGSYAFDELSDGSTEVTYRLKAELKVPLPGFVKKRAESLGMYAAMTDLKTRAEALAAQEPA